MIEWNYKSKLIFFEVSSNSNKKMSQKIYIDEILKSIIKSVFQKRKELILEKNDDSNYKS